MGHKLDNNKHHVILITTESQLKTWAWLEKRKFSLVSAILGLGLVFFTALLVVKICLMFHIEELTSKAEISNRVWVEKSKWSLIYCPFPMPLWFYCIFGPESITWKSIGMLLHIPSTIQELLFLRLSTKNSLYWFCFAQLVWYPNRQTSTICPIHKIFLQAHF